MEQTAEALSKYEENTKWISRNYTRLKKKYVNQWVAAHNKQIIDHDCNLDKLTKRLREEHPETHNQIAIEYITKKPVELIL